MKAWHKILFGLLAFLAFAVGLMPSWGAAVPDQAEALRMLKEEQFDELTRIGDELRREKLEFYNGKMRLMDYYGLFEIDEDLDDKTWSDHVKQLEKWAKASPDSPTPLVALANIYVSYAWKARGSGYANTVTDEGWRLFGGRLKQAKACLEKACRMPIKDPEAYRTLIQVAMGLGESREQIDAYFQKGIEVEPNYIPLYSAKAYYLLPRWMGEPGDWEAFARDAADARGGKEGDLLYMIIARSQARTEGDGFFAGTRISYERMKRGFEVALKWRSDNLWDTNSWCYFACIAGDRATAKDLFQKIGDRWQEGVWYDQSRFQAWKDWALHNGPNPSLSARYDPTVTLGRQTRKKVLVVGGIIWLVMATAIVVGCWLLIRQAGREERGGQ